MGRPFKTSTLLASCAFALGLCAAPMQAAAAPNDILFILDGSGSMWGQIDGVAKIQTAKTTLTKIMDDAPAESRLGFMTYGTKSKTSCTDVSVLNPIGADRGAIKQNIESVTPLGKTPIQRSLTDGMALLSGSEPEDVQKSLVLISDGIETCDGDPCAIAAKASENGVNMRVHVVGFNVDAKARNQLECIAQKGGGQYFDATDTDGFAAAMQEVVQVAQATPQPAPEPVVEEPKGPTITEFFRDDFDGTELSEIWAIENADPETYIVEGGKLTMLSTEIQQFSTEAPVNLITYTGDLPEGDWDAEITFTAQMPARGALYFGLRKDQENYMEGRYLRVNDGSCQAYRTNLEKMAGGKKDFVSFMFRGYNGICGRSASELGHEKDIAALEADLETKPVTLTISKRGRSYTAKTRQDGITFADGTPYEPTTSEYTSLRSPGTLSFTIGRYTKFTEGELFFEIDSVVINKVE